MKNQNLFSFKLILHVFWIIPLLFIINSCKDKKDPEPGNKPPGKFTVSVVPSDTSAILGWTEAIDPDGDAIKYAVVLGDTEKATSLEATNYTINSLELATSYNGKIIASDGKGGFSEAAFIFETNKKTNSPPEDFTVSSVVNANEATISWTESNDPDGDVVTYDLELGGTIITTGLTNLTHKLTDLEYNTSYTGKVIAKDGKGGMKEKAYNFETDSKPNSPPGSFTAKLDNLKSNTAYISWTTAIDPDGDAVTYSIERNGTVQASGLTGNSTKFNDLLYSTNYNITVKASDDKGGESSDSFSFSTLAAPSELPVTLFSNATNLIETHFKNQGDFEFGLEFEPIKDGTITALGAKLCIGDYLITLWDVAATKEITRVAVSINNSDKSCDFLHMEDITPVAVKKGVKYMVTVNANNWYNYKSTISGALIDILPVTKGNIKFTRYGYKSGPKGFPTTFLLTRFAGIAEFKFVPDH